MIKYKPFYMHEVGDYYDTLHIYFKCKNKECNQDYITVFMLAYYTGFVDSKPINLDNLISNFFRVIIYVDISINENLKIRENLKLINFDNILSYNSTFILCNFIKDSFDTFKNIYSSPNKFTITTLINEEYCNDIKDLLINIISSTLLYWDDK